MHRLLTYRVDEVNAVGKQRYTAVRIAARSTVFKVTLDRTANGGQLTSYLMMTACQQVNLNEVIVVGMGYEAVTQNGLFAMRLLCGVSTALVLFLVAHYPVRQFTLTLRRHILSNSPIGLMHFTAAEHTVEACQSLGGLGINHQARHRAVKTMSHTKEHIPRLGVLLLYIRLNHISEGEIAGLVTLYDLTTLFLNHYNVVIIIDNSQDSKL